jgi:hypothetical protein
VPCAQAEAEERKEASARPRGSGRSPSAARHYCQRPPLSSPSPPPPTSVRLLRCWHHLPRPHRRQAAAPWPPPRTEAAPRASSPRRGTGEGGEGRAPPVCGCTRPSLARLLSSIDRRRIVYYPFILGETKQKAAATARRGEDFEWGSGRVYIGAMEGRGRAWWRCARSAPSGRTRWRRGDKDNARGGGVRTREAPLSISRRHRPDRTPEHRNPEEADEKHADEGTRATPLQGLTSII